MKKTLNILAVGVMVISISGCLSTGLSLRERGSFNYSNFIYGLYGGDSKIPKEATKMKKPIKLAVAQVGETAPPKEMLNKLRGNNSLIASIDVIPLGGNESNNYYGGDKNQNTDDFKERMAKMRQLSKDLGSDYLFLFGGSSDMGEQQSWLGVLDFSIIGAYIFPTHKIVSEGKASGALIEVETGKVVFMVNAQESKVDYGTTYNLSGKQDQVMIKLRDILVESLTDQFIDKLSRY